MSKGSKQRPTNQAKFKENYGSIKWSDKPRWTPAPTRARRKTHHIMPDIEPYKAAGGEEDRRGEWITSRSKEREYLHRNGFEQVGSEKDYFFKYDGKTHDNPTRNWGRE